MSHCHITRITQIPNLEIRCKRYIGSKIAEIAADMSGPCLFIGDFGRKTLYRFGCAKSLRLGAVNAISGLYRGYLEHWGFEKRIRIGISVWKVEKEGKEFRASHPQPI